MDSTGSHDHGYSDTYWKRTEYGCGTAATVSNQGIDEDHSDDDWVCRYDRRTTINGGTETKPKNMNVIFIIRVW